MWKTGFQHSLHSLNLQVCVHSTNDLQTNKQKRDYIEKKEMKKEGRRGRVKRSYLDRESTFGWRNDSEEGNESGWAIYIFVLKTKRQIKLITALKKQNRIWGHPNYKTTFKSDEGMLRKERTREEKWWIMCIMYT